MNKRLKQILLLTFLIPMYLALASCATLRSPGKGMNIIVGPDVNGIQMKVSEMDKQGNEKEVLYNMDITDKINSSGYAEIPITNMKPGKSFGRRIYNIELTREGSSPVVVTISGGKIAWLDGFFGNSWIFFTGTLVDFLDGKVYKWDKPELVSGENVDVIGGYFGDGGFKFPGPRMYDVFEGGTVIINYSQDE